MILLLRRLTLLHGLLLPLLSLAAVFPYSVPAQAQDDTSDRDTPAAFTLPGVSSDASGYARSLAAKFPAGGTSAQRQRMEAQAADAARRNDWASATAALEERIGMANRAGGPDAGQWLALAQAQLRRSPPEARRALQAGWLTYRLRDTGADQVPALLVMAQALHVLNEPAQEIAALRAAVQRAPGDAALAQRLAQVRQEAGLLVTGLDTVVEADPPRACFSFASPPSHSPTFHPQDWVSLNPPIPDAAVTREGNQICVSGLPLAVTTTVTMRAGMPGYDGLVLKRDAVQPVAMGERAPRLTFDQRLFLLPRNQVPALTLTSTNVSAVRMRILRLSERTILPFVRDKQLGQTLERNDAETLTSDAQPVWVGHADIPDRARNRLVRTALPLPDVFAKPGLYALLVDHYKSGAKPDDQDYDGPFAAQMILRTDLAPTVWRGLDGLTVQLRGYADVQPRAGVKLQLMARNNDILAEQVTGADGVARFPVGLLHGTGPMAPQSLHAFLSEDFTAIDLTAAAFDLSDRGVAGRTNPGPLDSFIYLDRGIYRPGETVQIMALTRDAAGLVVADLPLRLRVTRPNGELFRDAVPERGPDGAVYWPVALSAGAPVGTWTVEVLADPAAPPIATRNFRVDAFVPDRMAVDIAPAGGPLVASRPYALPVAARWLYGAPAASLSASATMKLAVDSTGPAALTGYAIGLAGEEYTPDTTNIVVPDTDPKGHTAVPLALASAPDTTHPVAATVAVSVDDPSGRAVIAETSVPVRPGGNLIGIKPLFTDGVQPGADAGFDIAAVNPDGARTALTAVLHLVRERPDWRLVMNGRLGSLQIVWKDEPMETHDVSIPAGDPLRFARTLPFGRYRIEVAEKGTLAASSVRFRVGFVGSDSPDVPDKVDVSTERSSYAPGQAARVHIIAPFDGPATLVVLNDRVLALRDIAVSASGSDINVPVGADWGAGAYVAIHAFRPGGPAARPGRAIGLAWLGIDPATRRLEMSIGAPEKTVPRAPVVIPVSAVPGAWVTLAAVDEGVLRLTRFVTPDPLAHFMGKRTLGIDIRDDWGRLIAPADGTATVLRQGGDEDLGAPRKIPQQVVALFTPPVQAGPDGVARITLAMPDFNGQLRLMAVGWQGDRIGSASQDMLVRDRLIAEPLLPRFLAPGDEARMVVQLQNIELPAGAVTTDIAVDGPLRLAGPAQLAVTLAAPQEVGAQAIPATQLAATGAGTGHIRLAVSGPDGFHVERQAAIEVAPARGPTSLVTGGEMPPGASAALTLAIAQFIPGTWRATARFGGAVRYDPGAIVQALDAFPLWCLEQSASRGQPLTLLPEGAVAGADRLGRLQKAVIAVLDKQRYDGGFGLWSAEGEAQPWLSAYATEFLLRAKAAGVAVPEGGLDHALQFLISGLGGDMDSPAQMAMQAYRLYALALAGQPRMADARVLTTRLTELPTPLARAQLGAALALGNDRTSGAAAFQAALANPARKDWSADYGSALRDQLAIGVLLKESGLLPDLLSRLIGQLPGADLVPASLNMQEQAWAAAAAAVLSRDGEPAQIMLDGKALTPAAVVSVPLAGSVTAVNMGKKSVWQSVSVTGVLAQAPPAARDGMRITRRFFTLDGKPLDLDHLTQNSVFVLLLEGAALDGQDHRALLLQGLPAGWEITGRLGAGKVVGMDWLGELSATESEPALDDRYAAVIPISGRQPGFSVAVQLRAVTPGNFEIPGAELSDMYRPAIFARQGANRITVKAVE